MSKGNLDLSYDPSPGTRFAHKWGYVDTKFEFVGPRVVRVTGSRYPLAGYEMPDFIPFVEEVLGVPVRPEDAWEQVEHKAPTPVENASFTSHISDMLRKDQIGTEDADRLIHSHGQLSVDEIFRVIYTSSLDRVADVVLYPESEDDVRNIVKLAHANDVVVVPYGGGTNVSAALTLPADEKRMIAVVDMRRMKRILWIDGDNLTACVEAGIEGKDLEVRLDEMGYTSGHDPDSVELSTLGGWISTNASGMKKNRYGNIEDIVLEMSVVTPVGDLETRLVTPRNSHGTQPKYLMFGSEGNFGIITKAVLKIHPRPKVRQHGSLVFADFEHGVDFLREVRKTGVLPASIRLVNNFEFRFGQALKGPTKGFFKKIMHRLEKFVLFKVKGFDPKKMVACTVLMEGDPEEVAREKRVVFGIAKKYGGMSGGAKNGQRGYMLTFGIAYIRDFFNQYGIVGETFEASMPWTKIHQVTQACVKNLREECTQRGVEGNSYLSYRVTQTYHSGVCVYFTMGFSARGLKDPVKTYHDIEHSMRQTVIDNGGSLSHHHGIGKIRQGFLQQIESDANFAVVREAKRALDPKNIFAIRNNLIDGRES